MPVLIEQETLRTFVGLVTRMGDDVDREGHGLILVHDQTVVGGETSADLKNRPTLRRLNEAAGAADAARGLTEG